MGSKSFFSKRNNTYIGTMAGVSLEKEKRRNIVLIIFKQCEHKRMKERLDLRSPNLKDK